MIISFVAILAKFQPPPSPPPPGIANARPVSTTFSGAGPSLDTPLERGNPTDPAQNNEQPQRNPYQSWPAVHYGGHAALPYHCDQWRYLRAGVYDCFSSTGQLSRLKDLLGKAREVAGPVGDASGKDKSHRPQGPKKRQVNKNEVGLVETTSTANIRGQ